MENKEIKYWCPLCDSEKPKETRDVEAIKMVCRKHFKVIFIHMSCLIPDRKRVKNFFNIN